MKQVGVWLHYSPNQNFPFADMQACSLSSTQKVLWKDIWLLVSEIEVSMSLETQNLFLLEIYEMYTGIYDKKISIIFIKTCVER